MIKSFLQLLKVQAAFDLKLGNIYKFNILTRKLKIFQDFSEEY